MALAWVVGLGTTIVSAGFFHWTLAGIWGWMAWGLVLLVGEAFEVAGRSPRWMR